MKRLQKVLPLLLVFCLLAGCKSIGRTEYTEITPVPLASTTRTTATKTTKAPYRPTGTTVSAQSGKVLLNAPLLCQFPEYPMGSESVATVMALQYSGARVSVAQFIDNYLPRGSMPIDGKGPNPNNVFVGNPRSEDQAYGCLSGVIEKALITCASDMRHIVNASGMSLDELCQSYVNHDTPVMVWATVNMEAVKGEHSWSLNNGDEVALPTNLHCFLLVGYDTTRYYFNDPYTGEVVSYEKSVASQRYEDVGKHAVAIAK